MRAVINPLLDRTQEIWNFGQIVFKNRTVEKEDIKKLNVSESMKMVKCKSRNWEDIGKELQKKASVTAL